MSMVSPMVTKNNSFINQSKLESNDETILNKNHNEDKKEESDEDKAPSFANLKDFEDK
jgi:hypothetical protein